MVVRIAAARMIARWVHSPSSPTPAARRSAALGLDRSARPSKQEQPCRHWTLMTLIMSYLTASCAQ
jgi:hypothetical protein